MRALSLRQQILGLCGWLAVTFAAAALGAVASRQASGFYRELARPEWAPPAAVFPLVWNALYALMAIAAWLVWRRYGFRSARAALTLYLVQLLPNALWSWLFFAWRQGGWASVDIAGLWLLVLATLLAFARLHRPAAILLLPYLLWITFAAALGFTTWRMNPSAL